MIANYFTGFFGAVSYDSSSDSEAVHEFVETCNEWLCETQNSIYLADLINAECVDKCVRDLKDGKSCGHDGLSAEHLKHVHY